MKKRIIAFLLVAIIALAVFAGCESYRFKALTEVSDKNAVVESNGGLAVKQGKYVYFINAESDYDYADSKENYFNGKSNKLLGAIIRVKLDDNGAIVENSQTVVVPKNVMTSYTDGGFYIYGEWIYYTSPSTSSDSSGSLKPYLDVFRTKTDGTKTQKIVTVKSQNFQYTVTPQSFVYYDSTEKALHFIDTTGKKFKDKVVAEDINSIIFPENTTYNPASVNLYASAVFYTKNYDDDYKRANQVFALDTKGNTYCVMEENTWTPDPEKIENIKKVFVITLKSAKQTEKGIALYYKKQYYNGGSLTDGGLWTVEFDSASTPFVSDSKVNTVDSNEKKGSDTDITPTYVVDSDSFYYLDGNVLKQYKCVNPKENKEPEEKTLIDFGTSITFAFFSKSGNTDYIYYTKNSALYKIAFAFDDNGEFKPLTNEQTVLSSTSNISTSWLKAELIGNYYFYSNTSDKYTYVIDLSSFVNYDASSVKDFLVGKKVAVSDAE